MLQFPPAAGVHASQVDWKLKCFDKYEYERRCFCLS